MINGNVEGLELEGTISSSIEIEGDINNNLELEAEINPITQAGNNYNRLVNKPQINFVELEDNKTLDDLNIQVKGDYPNEALTNAEIEELIDSFV